MTLLHGRGSSRSLRILAVAETWEGSNGYAWVKAFRRQGHSITIVDAERLIPYEWRATGLRLLRRVLEPVLVREYEEALISEARALGPDVFFVFKGRYVTAAAVRTIRAGGATAVNVYPDVSFMVHGRHLPRALPEYDWIFQTKRFGIADLDRVLGMRRASYLPHAFDPDVHRPVELDALEHQKYDCDVSFVGTWSHKKAEALRLVCRAFPDLTIRIWGGGWKTAAPDLARWVQGRWVRGVEFSKALVGSRINLAVLAEIWPGASSGDQTTSRTFHIPATGAFMLHERTEELLEYFDEDRECACFGSTDELIDKIRYYLSRPEERERVAAAGRARVVSSGYSVDCRAETLLWKVRELSGARARVAQA